MNVMFVSMHVCTYIINQSILIKISNKFPNNKKTSIETQHLFVMFRNNFCLINEDIPRKHRPSNSQFLKQVIHEEEKCRQVRAQEILMTSENPMTKEQKQNEEICKELQIIEKEKFQEEKRRALLQQNDDELRELITHIKRAKVQKELVDQKSEQEKKLKENFKIRLEENKYLLEELERNREKSLKEDEENVQRKNAFRLELLKQMAEKDKQREEQRQVINKEREDRQKLLENIRKDIEGEKQDVLKTKDILKQERDEYLQQLELFKSQQKSDAEENHRKYLEWLKQRDEALRLRREKRQQAMQKREALSENIGKQIFSIEQEKQTRDNLLAELLIGERLAKDDKRYMLNAEDQRHRSKNLRDDFLKYFAAKQQESLLNRENKKLAFQEQLKMSRDLALAETEKKNLKILNNKQYREDLLNVMERKKCQREFEVQQSKVAFEQELARKQRYQQEVQAEKLRILKAQPLENLKFLPYKIISKEHRLALGLTCKETTGNAN